MRAFGMARARGETGSVAIEYAIILPVLLVLLIGLIESFWSGYFSIEYQNVAAFAILVLVLVFRPTGLLGRPEVEKG